MYNKYLFKNYTQGGILTLPKESNICFFLYIFKASFVLQNIRAILVMKLKKKHLYFIYYTYLRSFNFFKFSSGIYLKKCSYLFQKSFAITYCMVFLGNLSRKIQHSTYLENYNSSVIIWIALCISIKKN